MRELMKRIWKKEEGFSLIELIIVIAILAIIAAIAVPNLLGNISRSNETKDISNAKLIGDAIATTIAQNPEWEGTTMNAGTAFADFANPQNNSENILAGAVDQLSGVVPTLASNKFSNAVGDSFTLELTAEGNVIVSGTQAYDHDDDANTAATTQLFPQP